MEVVTAALADSAYESPDGKLTIQGIFDTIKVRRFPAYHGRTVFVFRLRLEYKDRFTGDLEIGLVDPDGRRLWGAGATIDPAVVVGPGEVRHVNSIVDLNSIRFAKPGNYRFEVIFGRKRHSTYFSVVEG